MLPPVFFYTFSNILGDITYIGKSSMLPLGHPVPKFDVGKVYIHPTLPHSSYALGLYCTVLFSFPKKEIWPFELPTHT